MQHQNNLMLNNQSNKLKSLNKLLNNQLNKLKLFNKLLNKSLNKSFNNKLKSINNQLNKLVQLKTLKFNNQLNKLKITVIFLTMKMKTLTNKKIFNNYNY